MADSDLQITFSGDASGLKTAAGDAGDAIRGVTSVVGDTQGALGQFQQAFATALQPPDVSAATQAAAQVAAAAQAAQAAITASAVSGANTATQANQQAATKVSADWNRSVGAWTEHFGDGLLKMAQGSETFSKLINQTANQIETYFVNSAAKMVSNWLFAETQKSAATTAGVTARTAAETTGQQQTLAMSALNALKNIVNLAAQAAAGAYQAIVGIPVVGPAAAPAAAAAALGSVEGFQGLVAAAGGYDIPAGVNPLVQAHAQEMILPARIANPMRDMLASYAGAASGPGGSASSAAASGGDVHNWNISAMDPRSFETYLRRNSDVLAGALNAKVRAGAKISGV